MEGLTFGEQVKIILGRKNMTIKELAESIEERTGKKMSRQNLTQRLGRDNFQEQDMRMIANILGCPFQLSIMSKEYSSSHGNERDEWCAEAYLGQPAQPCAVQGQEPQPYVGQEQTVQPQTVQEHPMQTAHQGLASGTSTQNGGQQAEEHQKDGDADEVDMTIGELYEMHEELSELEENAEAGVSVEVLKEELSKPGEMLKEKKEKFLTGGIFLRKKGQASQEKRQSQKDITQPSHGNTGEVKAGLSNADPSKEMNEKNVQEEGMQEKGVQEKSVQEKGVPGNEGNEKVGTVPEQEDFEPVIRHDDAEENLEVGDVNPYTGREFQTNSVRMHPSRIGYVQVYDRNTHKWTDMTEWAFLGYQERKKALLGKDYEPPIYLD